MLVWSLGRSWLLAPVLPRVHELVAESTAVRIERRSVPRPASAPAAAPAPPAQRPSRPAPAGAPAAAAHARVVAAVPHELARHRPTAPPQPTASPSAQPQQAAQGGQAPSLEQQQQAFAREIARLRASSSALSVATAAPHAPATFHRSYFDTPGNRPHRVVQALLTPIEHWYAGGDICYYVRYEAQFSAGGNEEGTVPWPVCYPRNDDHIAYPPYVHDVPIPVPQPGYTLPAGTYLTPFLASIYAQRRP